MVVTNKILGFGQLKSWPSFSIQAINLSNFFRKCLVTDEIMQADYKQTPDHEGYSS